MTPPASLEELSKYAYSSTSKTIEEGEYVAVSNGQGAFALVQIVDSQSRNHGGSIDGVVFTSSTFVGVPSIAFEDTAASIPEGNTASQPLTCLLYTSRCV